jgi:uncharacterized protein with HEPN domain
VSASKPDITYLQHIRDCCKTIIEYAGKLSIDEFLKDKKTQDAVIRNFEIIGEAVKHLSKDFRTKNSNIEWQKIAGLRDKLIHDYIGVDLWSVHALITDVIPKFSDDIEKIISESEEKK